MAYVVILFVISYLYFQSLARRCDGFIEELLYGLREKADSKDSRWSKCQNQTNGLLVILLVISSRIPQAESSFIGCSPCVYWAARFCASAISFGDSAAYLLMSPCYWGWRLCSRVRH